MSAKHFRRRVDLIAFDGYTWVFRIKSDTKDDHTYYPTINKQGHCFCQCEDYHYRKRPAGCTTKNDDTLCKHLKRCKVMMKRRRKREARNAAKSESGLDQHTEGGTPGPGQAE
jgi:hypothetical protein